MLPKTIPRGKRNHVLITLEISSNSLMKFAGKQPQIQACRVAFMKERKKYMEDNLAVIC